MVHGDVPEDCRKLGRVPEEVLQHSHSQLHGGGRVLGLNSDNSPRSHLAIKVTERRRNEPHDNMELPTNSTATAPIPVKSPGDRVYQRHGATE